MSPDLRAYLRSLDAATLAELLAEQAERDPRLRRELELRALADADEYAPPEIIPLDETAKAAPILDTLRRLLDAGSPADLTPLARRTVDRIAAAAGPHADPAVAAELRRAVALYARACATHPPDPGELADWFLRTRFEPGWPEIELADFAQALGDKGIRKIRSTVDEMLADGAEAAQALAEEVAEVTGDVDALLSLLAAKPPGLETSLKIVRALRAAGRHTEAIAHAAQVLAHEKGHERDAALALLRERAERDPAAADELVRVLLTENQPDEAWRIAEHCSLDLRLELAGYREADHPVDVIPVYRMHVERLITQKDASGYRQAALHLRKLRTLHKRADKAEEFSSYLAELMETHKRKTRLLAEVRNARIALPKAVN
ncbi:hypothetical protein [Amycolatopsis anabasis]|uniref:hypothetical protein n=1 Tax=Amycolatopsis anabasis TaxID=1840409 RepID=UPI00131B35D5|nr:hypothetical protein [Amycolatopsis anabasis]